MWYFLEKDCEWNYVCWLCLLPWQRLITAVGAHLQWLLSCSQVGKHRGNPSLLQFAKNLLLVLQSPLHKYRQGRGNEVKETLGKIEEFSGILLHLNSTSSEQLRRNCPRDAFYPGKVLGSKAGDSESAMPSESSGTQVTLQAEGRG